MVGVEGVLWECIHKCHHDSYNLVKPNSRTLDSSALVDKNMALATIF